MEPETLRDMIEILGTSTAQAADLLWALVVLQYLTALLEAGLVGLMFYGIYRGAKFVWQNREEIFG